MFLKEYNSIPGFLLRYTILKFSKLHIRIHKILTPDKTHFLHNHPFNYISIIIKGSYVEQLLVNDELKTIKHNTGSIIIRKYNQYHRITEVDNCQTLFFAWKKNINWNLKLNSEITDLIERPKDGMYQRTIKGRTVWSKVLNGIYYIGNEDLNIAKNETRCSIHQE